MSTVWSVVFEIFTKMPIYLKSRSQWPNFYKISNTPRVAYKSNLSLNRSIILEKEVFKVFHKSAYKIIKLRQLESDLVFTKIRRTLTDAPRCQIWVQLAKWLWRTWNFQGHSSCYVGQCNQICTNYNLGFLRNLQTKIWG